MTNLNKPVKRVSKSRVQQRPIVVTLYPGGFLGLRLKGRRREYQLGLDDLYWQAAKAEVRKKAREKAKKKAKKKR